jgi:hypothetical protein
MRTYTLQENPPRDQESWVFSVPPHALNTHEKGRGKFIKFTATAITYTISPLPSNRILQEDDVSKFILVSFNDLRFPDSFLRVTADYIIRLMKAGLFLNGVQYRFYHHSNSQLVSVLRHVCELHQQKRTELARTELLLARSQFRCRT